MGVQTGEVELQFARELRSQMQPSDDVVEPRVDDVALLLGELLQRRMEICTLSWSINRCTHH